jgi:hypothetical protein
MVHHVRHPGAMHSIEPGTHEHHVRGVCCGRLLRNILTIPADAFRARLCRPEMTQ